MEHLGEPTIAAGLARYWRACARQYHALPYRSSDEANPLRGLDDSTKRRQLIRVLLKLPDSEAHDVDCGEAGLRQPEDGVWMLEELPHITAEHRIVWAQVCARLLWHALPSCNEISCARGTPNFQSCKTPYRKCSGSTSLLQCDV